MVIINRHDESIIIYLSCQWETSCGEEHGDGGMRINCIYPSSLHSIANRLCPVVYRPKRCVVGGTRSCQSRCFWLPTKERPSWFLPLCCSMPRIFWVYLCPVPPVRVAECWFWRTAFLWKTPPVLCYPGSLCRIRRRTLQSACPTRWMVWIL